MSAQNIQKESIYLSKRNGDTIRITGEISGTVKNVVLITVEEIKNSNFRLLQNFETRYSSYLDITLASFNSANGIFVKYDPAVRYGNSFLYLFNEETNQLKEVKGYRDLGMVSTIITNNQKYYYSYASCGCADNCWESKLFEIRNYEIYATAFLSCDCQILIEKSEKNTEKTSKDCKLFNNDEKFDQINTYWKEKIKNGL